MLSRAFFVAIILALFAGATLPATNAHATELVAIHFFWGDGCPHCAEARVFLEELIERHSGAELRPYEVWYSEANAAVFAEMAEAHGFVPTGIPTIIIGDRYWVGFSAQLGPEIEATLEACLDAGCNGLTSPIQQPPSQTIDLPFIGSVDLAGRSLWVSTALIAFVDGFNPCSLWVLTVLVALALHTGSRAKVLTIGMIFIAVTAGVYTLFIAGLFTILTVVGVVVWVRIVVALIALVFGGINVKDYFWYQEGLSFTIDDRSKPGIYRRMRRVMEASGSFWPLAGATVVLAMAVSVVEFACTAGFPILWTNILLAQEASGTEFSLLLLLYMTIYQMDELAVFLVAVFTLRASRIEERHGRVLKLIGGVLMLTLAGIMIFNPSLMDTLTGSLIVFGVAFAATGVVLVMHRKILPALGIWIGSEEPLRKERPKYGRQPNGRGLSN